MHSYICIGMSNAILQHMDHYKHIIAGVEMHSISHIYRAACKEKKKLKNG